MKKSIMVVVAIAVECAVAVPTSNNFHSVTNDWYNGNYSNVYELAQLRLVADANDVVGIHLKVAFDIYHSDSQVISNDISRLVEVSDAIDNPAFTNVYNVLRPDYISYRDEFIPSVAEAERLVEQAKSRCVHKPIPGCFLLKILWENGLWGN